MNNLASVVKNINRLKEAEILYREALTFRKAILFKNHPDIEASINNLDGVLRV